MQLSVDDLLQVIQNFRIRNFLRTPFTVLPLCFPGRQSEIFRIRKIRTCQGAYSYTITRFPCILSSRPEVVLHSLISGSISKLLMLPSQFFIFHHLNQNFAPIHCPLSVLPLRLLIAAMPELFVYEKFGPLPAVTRYCRYRGGVPVLQCNRRN